MTPILNFLRSRTGRAIVESAMVVVTLVWATNWGTWYWNQSLSIGRHPFFYQLYYEPAVMLACGKGFVVAQPQVPAMTRFLQEQTTEFDCKDIPANAKLGTDGMYQGGSRYIMTAVGLTWRTTGVSWRKLGPVAGLLFGISIAAAYGIFRLGMGRVLSALLAAALSVSPLHLLNLPHIRDYSKAPFALLLIFLLGLLVTMRPTWKRVLLVAAAYGLVMGIGYGFRTDLLINIPAFVLAALLFLDARFPQRVAFAAAGSALCLATFAICAWPIITAVNQTWGCQWHVAVLGLGEDYTRGLQLQPAEYDWLDGFTDEFAYATTTSYGARVHPGLKHVEYCQKDYDDVTREFMVDVAGHTPADFIVRAYASSLRMVQLPLRWRKPPMPHVATDYYKLRTAAISHATGIGVFLVAAAIVLIAASSVRLGLFTIAFVLYFGGYPAVQFGNRHFFHLEFITWWAFGFLLQQIVTAAIAAVRRQPLPRVALTRGAIVMAGSFAVLLVALWTARWYQAAKLRPLMQQYVDAQVQPLAAEEGPGRVRRVAPASPKTTDPETADLLLVTLNEWQCPAESKLTFVYPRPQRLGFARDVELKPGLAHTSTRIFLPVYGMFQGITVGDAPPGCLNSISRVLHPDRFTLMPKVTLRPGSEARPLYQTLDGWGIEPPPDE